MSRAAGNHFAWDGTDKTKNKDGALDEKIWKAFATYKDTDGYYFLQQAWQVKETKEFT